MWEEECGMEEKEKGLGLLKMEYGHVYLFQGKTRSLLIVFASHQ
jgi:hypothetical protein